MSVYAEMLKYYWSERSSKISQAKTTKQIRIIKLLPNSIPFTVKNIALFMAVKLMRFAAAEKELLEINGPSNQLG